MTVPRQPDDNYYMYHQYGDNLMPPVGPIGLIMHNIDPEFSDSVNYYLRNRRSIYLNRHPELATTPGFMRIDYRVPVTTPRFSSGEGKAVLGQSVRGHDLFIVTDVLNYDTYYTRFGQQSSLTPDEHYQDLVRIILANSGNARRINIIMPYLYEGRQDQRNTRESLDCAHMLQHLFSLGISNLLTFDAHDSRIDNAVPGRGLENLPTSYHLIKTLFKHVPDLKLDNEHFMVVAPDENTINRAIFYASMLEVPIGIVYRRLDYHAVIDGRYPTIGHEFLGEDVAERDILLVDDMIVTGKTMLRAAKDLKAQGAGRIFCATTFPQFTDGIAAFDEACRKGTIDKLFGTDLAFRSHELRRAPWYIDVSMARYVALLIDAINHDASLSSLISPTIKIAKRLDYYKRRRNP